MEMLGLVDVGGSQGREKAYRQGGELHCDG
jgi:hypothetical protein